MHYQTPSGFRARRFRSRRTTMIPVEGDRKLVVAMHLLACQQNTTISTLVRTALFATYGDRLRPLLDQPLDCSPDAVRKLRARRRRSPWKTAQATS